jgi:hypothetical protein
MIFFTGLMAFATAALVWFNCKLVTVTKDLHTATKAATEAAHKSAEAAQLALNVEKPYLFIETPRFEISNVEFPNLYGKVTTTYLTFHLRNRGKGVGIVEDIRLKQCRLPNHDSLARLNTLDSGSMFIARRNIGPSEFIEPFAVVPVQMAPPPIGFMFGLVMDS